jgi:hypothetical protein
MAMIGSTMPSSERWRRSRITTSSTTSSTELESNAHAAHRHPHHRAPALTKSSCAPAASITRWYPPEWNRTGKGKSCCGHGSVLIATGLSVHPGGSGIESLRQIRLGDSRSPRVAEPLLRALSADSPKASALCPPSAKRSRDVADGVGARRASSNHDEFPFRFGGHRSQRIFAPVFQN